MLAEKKLTTADWSVKSTLFRLSVRILINYLEKFKLFGINIFWTKDPLIAFYSIASVNVIFGVYSTYLNKKRLMNKELVSPERRYQEEN